MLIFGLMLLLLLETAACVEVTCSFNQSDPCYTALGDQLNLLLDASIQNLTIRKRIYNNNTADPVCRIKNGMMKKNECDLYNNRPEVTVINGALIINRVIRADSGNYTLTLESSNGTITCKYLQVIVEALDSVILIVLGCFAVILIVLVAAGYYIYRKRIWLKPKDASRGPQTNRNQKEQELHYGEVTFTDGKVRQQPNKKAQEESLYAQVQTR